MTNVAVLAENVEEKERKFWIPMLKLRVESAKGVLILTECKFDSFSQY